MTERKQATEATGTPTKADAVGSQVDLVLGPLPEADMKADPCSADGTQTNYYTAGTVHRLLAAERERCVPDVDGLAQHIRWLNGSNAGTLAEKLVDWLRSRA